MSEVQRKDPKNRSSYFKLNFNPPELSPLSKEELSIVKQWCKKMRRNWRDVAASVVDVTFILTGRRPSGLELVEGTNHRSRKERS